MVTTTTPVNFINLSYFFQLIYNAVVSGHLPSLADAETSLLGLVSSIWFWVCILAYLFSLACIGALVYYSIRLRQSQNELDVQFETIPKSVAHQQVEHSRWRHVQELIESPHEGDWRNAIIEADIMLDEMLNRHGYMGNTIGDKLKTANANHFHTLQDAWAAHTVRNEIAHQGSAYKLSPNIAYRTIGHFENVFREFGEI